MQIPGNAPKNSGYIKDCSTSGRSTGMSCWGQRLSAEDVRSKVPRGCGVEGGFPSPLGKGLGYIIFLLLSGK